MEGEDQTFWYILMCMYQLYIATGKIYISTGKEHIDKQVKYLFLFAVKRFSFAKV